MEETTCSGVQNRDYPGVNFKVCRLTKGRFSGNSSKISGKSEKHPNIIGKMTRNS